MKLVNNFPCIIFNLSYKYQRNNSCKIQAAKFVLCYSFLELMTPVSVER
jgi:hypothetical protein